MGLNLNTVHSCEVQRPDVRTTTHLSLKHDTMICICKYSGEAEVERNTFTTAAVEVGGWPAPGPGSFTPGKDPVHIVQEAEWALRPI
jgi:hypothetical protein